MHICNIGTRRHPTDPSKNIVFGCLNEFEVWFELPDQLKTSNTADAFVVAALMVAMKSGENISVDSRYSVSKKLLLGLDLVQDLYVAWFPFCKRVSITAKASSAEPANDGYASFFSGGVDGLYTFYRQRENISHLLFLGGVDIQLDNKELIDEALRNNAEFADEHGKTLVPILTNLRNYCHAQGLSWGNQYSGAGLASVALLLGFPFTFVPASQSHDMHYPDATSPALDHLFSNEATTIYYEGAVNRPTKIRDLGKIDGSMNRLRVCWQDKDYNCGQCEKCVRTMLLLHMYGLNCPTLPEFQGWSSTKSWRIESDGQARITAGLIWAAQETGRKDVYRRLVSFKRRQFMKRWLVALDKKVLNGAMKKVFLVTVGQRRSV